MKTFTIIFVVMFGEAIGAPFLQGLFGEAFGAPFLERLFGLNRKKTGRQVQTEKARGRTHKEICRAINPAPYAFPNKFPKGVVC
jgi:hypothetical protein